MTVGLGAALGILGVHAVMDVQKKRVNLILMGICLAAGVIWQVFGQKPMLERFSCPVFRERCFWLWHT